ncbi:hypothetical protein ES707_21037 [subsurface metagenome]
MTDRQVSQAIERISSYCGSSPELWKSDPQQRHRLDIEAGKAEQVLAAEYGRRRGWKRAERHFSILALRDRKRWSEKLLHGVWDPDNRFPSDLADHAYFYRFPGGRAAGVVCHLYDVPDCLYTWAAARGLRVSLPKDFPSWHNPGRTKLVVYEGGKEPGGEVGQVNIYHDDWCALLADRGLCNPGRN